MSLSFVVCHEIFAEFRKVSVNNGLSHIPHELEQEVQVMDGDETEGKKFFGLIEMTDISPAVMGAGDRKSVV